MEISTLSRNARLLAEEGLIGIEHAKHGNGRVLSLTAAGGERLVELRPAWRAAQDEAQAMLGDDAAGSIKRLVDRMFIEQLTAAPAACSRERRPSMS